MTRDRTGSSLTAGAAIRFLLTRGLLDAADLVDGDVRVEDVSGRNRNLRVRSTRRRSFFIKQGPPEEPATHLATEAWVLNEARPDRRAPALAGLVPALVLHDARRGVLLTELLSDDARPAHHVVNGADSSQGPSIAGALGRALAACHGVPVPRNAERARRGPPVTPPWILNIHRPRPDTLRFASPAQVLLISILQQHAAASALLDGLRTAWSPRALIHGDIKWSNLLVQGAESPTLWLLDWEFASWGDPGWDVGSVLHSYLVDCLVRAAEASETLEEASAEFAAALPHAQREMRAFWSAYTHAHVHAIQYTAARLIQTAWESCEREETMSRYATTELQLALNIAADPESAAELLLGS